MGPSQGCSRVAAGAAAAAAAPAPVRVYSRLQAQPIPRSLAAHVARPQLQQAVQGCHSRAAVQLARRRQQQWRHHRCQVIRAAAIPSAAPAASDAPGDQSGRRGGLGRLLEPFSDPTANKKLLALCTAQMLGSIATLIHETYLPVYLSDELHLSNTKIGNLQAAAQFLAKFSGSISGILADLVSPARMVILGTLLSTLNKPMYAASGAVYAALGTTACLYWITFAKIFDRTSKGIREAPTKALIGELAAASGDSPAAAFSLRHSLATLGAMVGALAASLALQLSGRNYPLTFALSAVPATLALLLVISAFGGGRDGVGGRGKEEPTAVAPATGAGTPCGDVATASGGSSAAENATDGTPALGMLGKGRALLGALRPAYWQALATISILYFARFDIAFGTLRARQVMDSSKLPLLIPVVLLSQGALAAPMGLQAKASARARNNLLLAGMAVLIVGNLCFAFMPSVSGMVLGAFCIGVHMAMTHGVSLGMLSSYIPSAPVPGLGKVSGTCWSATDLLLGFVLASSNSLAGRLSDLTLRKGMDGIGCFLGGATACALAMVALLVFSTWGELGRDDLLQQGAQGRAAPPNAKLA